MQLINKQFKFWWENKNNTSQGTNIYQFGDRNLFTAIEKVDIPVVLGKQPAMLNTDIVAKDIPLLLSRKSNKMTDMALDFKNDKAIAFGIS